MKPTAMTERRSRQTRDALSHPRESPLKELGAAAQIEAESPTGERQRYGHRSRSRGRPAISLALGPREEIQIGSRQDVDGDMQSPRKEQLGPAREGSPSTQVHALERRSP